MSIVQLAGENQLGLIQVAKRLIKQLTETNKLDYYLYLRRANRYTILKLTVTLNSKIKIHGDVASGQSRFLLLTTLSSIEVLVGLCVAMVTLKSWIVCHRSLMQFGAQPFFSCTGLAYLQVFFNLMSCCNLVSSSFALLSWHLFLVAGQSLSQGVCLHLVFSVNLYRS